MDPAREAGIVSPIFLYSISTCNPTPSRLAILLTQNVSPSRTINFDPESLPSLDDANLAWLHVHWPKFGQDIKRPKLWHNEKIAIGVHRRPSVHARIA